MRRSERRAPAAPPPNLRTGLARRSGEGSWEGPCDEERTWKGLLLPLGAILALFGIALAIWFVFDQRASANTAAILYDLIGNNTEAELLRAGSGNQVVPKIILAAVALTVLPEIARQFEEYRMLIFGTVMVLMMIWRPQGLLPSTRPRMALPT